MNPAGSPGIDLADKVYSQSSAVRAFITRAASHVFALSNTVYVGHYCHILWEEGKAEENTMPF